MVPAGNHTDSSDVLTKNQKRFVVRNDLVNNTQASLISTEFGITRRDKTFTNKRNPNQEGKK